MQRLERDANGTQSEASANRRQHPADHGMQMKVLVSITVIELESRGLKRRKLRGDLRSKLLSGLAAACDQRSDLRHVGTERATIVHETAHGRGRKNGATFNQHQVQADTQGGQAACNRHGIGGRRPRHHQARGRQNPVPVSGLDSLVDFRGGTEIVRRHDQLLQAVSRRVRRKRKNSTPSRKRRFIISGLAIISPTIEAILEGRK